MSNKAVVSVLLLLFFVVVGGVCAALCGYFYDVGGHGNAASALGWTAGIYLSGAVACSISFFAALWESQ